MATVAVCVECLGRVDIAGSGKASITVICPKCSERLRHELEPRRFPLRSYRVYKRVGSDQYVTESYEADPLQSTKAT